MASSEPQQGSRSGPGSQPLQEAAQAGQLSAAALTRKPDARDSLQASCDEEQRPPLRPVQGADNSLNQLLTPMRELLLSPQRPLQPGEKWSPRRIQRELGATLRSPIGGARSTVSLTPQCSRAPVGPPGRNGE